MPRTSKCSAAAVPALMVPASISKSSGAASRSYHSVTSVRVTPRPAAIWRTTLPQAMVSTPGRQQQGHVVQVAAEAHDVEEHHRLVVGVVVEHLGAAHLLDALADAREDERQRVVGEARVDAVDEERDAGLRSPPRSAGAAIGSSGSGYCRNTGLEDTTLMPAARKRSRSARASKMRSSAMAVCTMQSGSRASSASTSLVPGHAERAARARPAPRRRAPPCRGWTRRARPARARDGRRSRPGRGARRCRCSTARRGTAWRCLLEVRGRGGASRGWATAGRRRPR